MGKGPAKAAAAGMPAISAPRGTKEFRRQIAAREEWVKSVAEQGGWKALEDLGIANEEGMGRGIYRTYGPGGYFSQYGGAYNTNFIYDWGTGRKLNIATNAQAFPGEIMQNSQGQWVFDPNKASAERWESITPEEYAGYQQQQQWGAQNPGANTFADMLSHQRLMRDVRAGHLTRDPRSGNYYNIRPDGSVEWKDKYGRPIGGGASSGSMYDSQGGGFVSSYSSGGPSGGFAPWGGGGVSGGPAGLSPMPAGPAGGGGYGYGQGFAPGGGTDYGGIMGPYLGTEANLNQILYQQAQLDLLGQNLNTRKGELEYLEGRPIENYLTDFWGSILGVGFDPVDSSGISDYFDAGMASGPPPVNYTPGGPLGPPSGPGGIPPKYPGNPYPPSGPHGPNPTWPDPATGGIGGPNGVIPGKPWVDPLGGEEGNGIPQGGIEGPEPAEPVSGGASAYKVMSSGGGGGGVSAYTKVDPMGGVDSEGSQNNSGPGGGGAGLPIPPGLLSGGGGGAVPPPSSGSGGGGGFWPPMPGTKPIYEEPPNGMTPEEYWNAQGGFPDGTPSWFTEWINSGGAPWQYGGGWPGQPGYNSGTLNIPSPGALPKLPPLPELVGGQGGYHSLEGNFNPGKSNTWGMLALPAQGVSEDTNAMVERLKRELPEGGERDKAIAEAMRGGYTNIAHMRQGLVQDALSNLDAISQRKKFGVPMTPYSGSGQSMLNAYTNRYATDVGAASSRYAADLGARTSRYNTDTQYKLGLQQLKNQNSGWGNFMNILGGLGGSLLGNAGLFT